MLISRPRSMIPWCCFIPSASGIIASLMSIFMFLNFPTNCRIMIWVLTFSISLTMVGNSLILLQKVYLVLCRERWVLYISIPLISPQLAYAFIMIYCDFTTLEEKYGCVLYYPQFLLFYWLSVNLSINILFSAIFCHVALKQYRLFGSDAWKKLARNGIQTMSLAALCSIFVQFS
ncbi:hypothetical protein BDF19DRAFT_182970 [Syncephalis fuscata]|nr:hypothetical protein BDF19DRAFT_182970 [Syncephalis fuscata]